VVSKQQNYKLIRFIRENSPGVALRTTLLTGHPGEGKKEFAELRDFVEEVKFDRLGVFTYSEEEDTFAAGHYKDTVSERVKRERADELMSIQQGISKKLNDNKLGKSIKVLIDGREGEYYVGRSEADSPEVDNEVLIPAAGITLQPGTFCTVRITRTEEFDLFGEVEQ
jgi:ribosomal protein S12 methylthiotransferase